MGQYDNSANFGKQLILKHLKLIMEEKGITMYKLSKLTGISESVLSMNFREETQMTLLNFLKICGALNIRPYLIPAELDPNDMTNSVHFS